MNSPCIWKLTIESMAEVTIINNWLVVSVHPSTYRYIREVSNYERSVKVTRGDRRVRL